MIRLEKKHYSMILSEKQRKYQHYHVETFYENILQVKLSYRKRILKYLTGEKILPSDQRRVIEQAKFTNFFRKSFRKTNKSD